MKISKIYLLVLAALTFAACDPLEDVYKEMDQEPAPITADLEITLVDDDYELSGDDNAAKYKTFGSEDAAKAGIPNILSAKYPQLGATSSAIVHYDLYQGSIKYLYDDWKADLWNPLPVENPIPTYTVTQADYDEILGTPNYGNFDSPEDINAFLNWKYPDAWNNTGVELTYDWYNGAFTERDKVANWSLHYGVWYEQNVLADEDYEYMERPKHYFSSMDDAEYKIPIWLTKTQLPYAEAGDRYLVQFTYKDYGDSGNKKPRLVLSEFNGTEWIAIGSVIPAILKLGHDGEKWVPDNTIKYTMQTADYDWVVANYADVNPDGVASMARYGNYDITIWSQSEIESSIGDILMNNFPDSPEGQKYLVTYNVWTGSASDSPTIHMVRVGDKYVPVEK